MQKQLLKDQCWYQIVNDKFRVDTEEGKINGILTCQCVECKYTITSSIYQQPDCGSRYCKDCYDKLKDTYYCSECNDDSKSIVHNKGNIFTDNAMIKELQKKMIKCPDCKSDLAVTNLEEHVKICKKGWVICETCNSLRKRDIKHECVESGISTKQSSKLYQMCDGCGKESKMTDKHQCVFQSKQYCPYCCENYKGNLQEHRAKNEIRHLNKLCAVFKAQYNANEESASTWLTPTIDIVKKKIPCDVKSVKTVKYEIINLKYEVLNEIEINNIVKINLNNQMMNIQSTSFDGTIMWRIDNFSKVKSNATEGIQKSIFSPAFYTSQFGYKMCLRLYPNGDTSAHEKAMSLFLVIMKGDYDSILNWPFKQKVTFILVDPEFKTNWIDAFIPSENMSSFSRPRTDMNIPSGSSFFIKFEDMKQNTFGYAKDDTMFIRCIVDCSDLID